MALLDAVKKKSTKKTDDSEEVNNKKSSKKVSQQKIDDILEVLKIPATFEIPRDVFLPDDLKNVSFDIQVPEGYDPGQVIKFVSQSRQTVKHYVKLLKKRNEDVAKLASAVDKLQVDLNNMKFDNETAQGMSIMPTNDDSDLENLLMEQKLQIKRLEETIQRREQALAEAEEMIENLESPAPVIPVPTMSQREDREEILSLRDENTILASEKELLEEEVLHLKSKIAAMEENREEDPVSDVENRTLTADELRELGVELPEDDIAPEVDVGDGFGALPVPDEPVRQKQAPVQEEVNIEKLMEETSDISGSEWDIGGDSFNNGDDENVSVENSSENFVEDSVDDSSELESDVDVSSERTISLDYDDADDDYDADVIEKLMEQWDS